MSLLHPTSATDLVQGAIIGVVLDDLLRAGFAIDVNDNDGDRETHIARSTDKAAILAALFNPEIDSADYCLDCWLGDYNKHSHGFVRLIDGNGVDVISDYSTVMEKYTERASKLAAHIDEGWSAEGWAVHRLHEVEKAARNLLIWSDPLHPEHDAMVEREADDAAGREEWPTTQAVTERLRAELVKALEVSP